MTVSSLLITNFNVHQKLLEDDTCTTKYVAMLHNVNIYLAAVGQI
jgi:hypothetical protein